MTGLVWYAAYGSNLWSARFLTYLTGGPVPHSPAGRVQAGARDPSSPLDHRPARLPGRLLFGRSSSGWGDGGIAFLDPATPTGDAVGALSARNAYTVGGGEAGVLGRLWLITTDQFADVASQENGHPLPPGAADPARLTPGSHHDVSDGWYGRLLHLGPGPDGHPVLTFTCPDAATLPRRPAHPAYLRVIGLGLVETWGLAPDVAARHLAACDGNTDLDPATVATLAADLAADAAADRAARP